MNVHRSALSEEAGAASLGAREVETFLNDNPGVQYVDAVFVDLCGNVRGKRLASAELPGLFESGLSVPASIYFLDARGDVVSGLTALESVTGTAWPVAGSLSRVIWGQKPHGQVLLTLRDAKGSAFFGEPRNVLKRVVGRFADFDVVPALGFEIDVHLIARERSKDGAPVSLDPSETGAQDRILADIAAAAEAQRLAALKVQTAGARVRCRFEGESDAVVAADQAVFLRQIVRAIARRHGCDATFMARPFLASAGSGLRVAVDLRREAGGSVFASDAGGELARFAVGGLQALAVESLALFAPSGNAFRRFGGAGATARNRRWGYGNATANLTIESRGASELVVSHRVAAADANPYLVAAAILAGVHHGIAQHIDPGPATKDDVGALVDPTFPTSIDAALLALENGSVAREYLGPAYVDLYCATKRAELDRFRDVIPPHEFDWYA